jgi:hypothetical protein
MIQVEIKKEWVENAKDKAKELGVLKHSFMKGQGNIIGFLGEIVVSDFLKAKIENTYDYDLVKGNVKIDVKSKKCTSKPKDYYECSVAAYNTRQKCDFYVFVRILDNLETGWICGIINKKKFFENATLYKKGYTDTSNMMTFKEDTYNTKIKDLIDFKILLENKREV